MIVMMRGRAGLRTTTALLLMLAAMPAMAQQERPIDDGDNRLVLDPITILAYRHEAGSRDVAASISVIGGDQIAARGLGDMQSLVRYTPGVTVTRQTSGANAASSLTGFTIRGVGGNRVQMVVDGARVPELITDGTRDYLDLSFTKQVEIVKGPASVLWGSDALGGIVAVSTLDPEDLLQGREFGGSARLSHDTLNAATGISGAFAQQLGRDLQVMIGASRVDSDEVELSNARDDGGIYGCPRNLDYGATPCGSLNPMDVATDRVLGKAVWTPSDAHRLEFTFDHMKRDTDIQFNSTLGPVYSTVTGLPTGEIIHNYDREMRVKRRNYAVEHQWTIGAPLLDEVKTTLSYSPGGYERIGRRQYQSAAGDQMFADEFLSFDEDFLQLDIQAISRFTTGAADHVLTWGFDGDRAKTDYRSRTTTRNLTTGDITEIRGSGFNFANADTRRADIYLHDRISLLDGNLEITPGLRYATYSIDPRADGDYAVTPGFEPRERKDEKLLKSIGALYRFGNGWQVWGHYGEGFKMPTAQQLYTSLPGAFFDLIPAPDLEPERVKSIELGLRRELPRGYFGVTAFNADYDNFIQSLYNIPGTNQYTYRNLSEVHVWGIEAEAAHEITDRLMLTGSASWQKGDQRSQAGAEKTPHTLPPLTATLGLRWQIPQQRLTLDLIGTFASAVKYVENDQRFKPAGHGVIDAFAQWEFADNAVLNLGVRNLFDKRYFEASAAGFNQTASSSVAQVNPIELQTGPGRVFTASLDYRF